MKIVKVDTVHTPGIILPQHITGTEMVRIIIREEGIKGLYSGLSVNLLRGMTGGTILLVGYDEAKKFLSSVNVS